MSGPAGSEQHAGAADGDLDLAMRCDRDHGELRDAVRRICADFPAAYWRALDERRGYPTEFVEALTAAGFLGLGNIEAGSLAAFWQAAVPAWARLLAERGATLPPVRR